MLYTLKKGEQEVIICPRIVDFKSFKVDELFVTVGETVNHGDIIGEFSNEHITFEFESFYTGKVIELIAEDTPIIEGDYIGKIEGI